MESTVNVEGMLTQKQAELDQVKAQMQQIDQQAVQLQKAKDQLLTKGIELQGQVKLLSDMLPKKEVVNS